MKRRLLAITMAILFVLAMAVPVFADGEGVSGEPRTIPDERLLPRIVDDADLISDNQLAKIESELQTISDEKNLDVVICFVNSFTQNTVTEAADDYFDYNGFGIGSDHEGILMYVCMGTRDVWFSTTGPTTISQFTDSNISNMVSDVGPYLTDGDYVGACEQYISCVDYYTSEHFNGILAGIIFGIFGIGGAVTGGLKVSSAKKKLVSVRYKTEANTYLRPNSYILKNRNVNHIRTDVNRVYDPEPKESSGGGGSGSSTHVGSSGTTHGGGGGKF